MLDQTDQTDQCEHCGSNPRDEWRSGWLIAVIVFLSFVPLTFAAGCMFGVTYGV
jgi:hypothetical protein